MIATADPADSDAERPERRAGGLFDGLINDDHQWERFYRARNRWDSDAEVLSVELTCDRRLIPMLQDRHLSVVLLMTAIHEFCCRGSCLLSVCSRAWNRDLSGE